nr:SIP domain-containing protein [Boudabousia marimammalium]
MCESKVLLSTRRYLFKEVGVDKNDMYVHAYWVQGKAMGSSRDTSK